jgi:repressor LexA
VFWRGIMKELTKKQDSILSYIQNCVSDYGRPPTIKEICQEFGYKSNQSAVDHLNALHKKGYIDLVGKSRGILLLQKTEERTKIRIIGDVAAGSPLTATEDFVGYFDLQDYYEPDSTYMLKVKGDSMKNAGIMDGDYVFVRYQLTVDHNDIAVAVVDEEATVKRIRYAGTKVILVPENENFKEIVIDNQAPNFRIAGKVVGVFRTIR